MRKRARIMSSTGFLVLLLILVLRFTFFHTFILSQKVRFRTEALLKPGLALTRLPLPVDQLYKNENGREWKDQNRELVLDGKHYEVLLIDVQEVAAHLTLLEDEQENRLFTAFFGLTENQKKNFSIISGLIFGLHFSADPCIRLIAPPELRPIFARIPDDPLTKGHLHKVHHPPTAFTAV